MNLNHVTIAGRLARAPELKSLPSGQKVASFSIATSRKYTDKQGGKREDTEWHNMVAFGRTAEVLAQYVVKGQVLLVQGRLQTRSWDKDGIKQYRTEIVVDHFEFGEKPRGASAPASQSQDEHPLAGEFDAPPGEEINPEDIPF